MNTNFEHVPGAFEERDSLLVAALHLIADHAETNSEHFVASVIRESAVALDEYRGGYRLAYPQPDTGFHLVELAVESVSGTEVATEAGEISLPMQAVGMVFKFQIGDPVCALHVDPKVSFADRPVHKVRSGTVVGTLADEGTASYVVDIDGELIPFAEGQLWRVGEAEEVAP